MRLRFDMLRTPGHFVYRWHHVLRICRGWVELLHKQSDVLRQRQLCWFR
jgi:hypothetical protein